MDKVVFLDRDGVINRCAPPHEYVTRWRDFVILPGVPKSIRKLNDAGYKVVVISNQRCVARGLATEQQIADLHIRLNQKLALSSAYIDAFYICPHDIGQCHCRKPEIGLFLQAEQQFAVDKRHSWMIGDSIDDITAGKAYGVGTIFVGEEPYGDYACAGLSQAAAIIIEKDGCVL